MQLLLTRPLALSERFRDQVNALCPGKFTTTISPVLDIRPEPCSVDLSGVQAILFSSRQAVVAFAERSAERQVPALCVGDATAADARDAGFSVQSADGDGAALAQLAALSFLPDAGTMLHFRGAHTTGDIVAALQAEGINAEDRILYDQVALRFNDDAKALLKGPERVVAPVFSPRSAYLFAQGCREIAATAPLLGITMSSAVTQNFVVPDAHMLEMARPRADLILKALHEL